MCTADSLVLAQYRITVCGRSRLFAYQYRSERLLERDGRARVMMAGCLAVKLLCVECGGRHGGYVPLSLRRRRDSDGKIIGKGGSNRPYLRPRTMIRLIRQYLRFSAAQTGYTRLNLYMVANSTGAKRDEVRISHSLPYVGGVDRVFRCSGQTRSRSGNWLSPLVAQPCCA